MCGYLEDYTSKKETEWICECLLAPKLLGGRKKRATFCKQDCKVKIESRTYIDCNRREVFEELFDFDRRYNYPRSIIDGDKTGGIEEYERSNWKPKFSA